MADINRLALANDIAIQMKELGLGLRAAVRTWKPYGLNGATLSRVLNEIPVSAANTLLVCDIFELDARTYLVRDARNVMTPFGDTERKQFQPVTPHVSRMTSEDRQRIARS